MPNCDLMSRVGNLWQGLRAIAIAVVAATALTPTVGQAQTDAKPKEGARETAHGKAERTARAARDDLRLPRVLFFANPMESDNDVIRRPAPETLSIAERHFAE